MHTHTPTYHLQAIHATRTIGEKLWAVSVNAEQATVHKAEPSTQATARLTRPYKLSSISKLGRAQRVTFGINS